MTILRTELSNASYSRTNMSTLTIHSSHIKRRQDITVYHQSNLADHTPIVLLLHGVYGSNWVWTELGGVHKVYEKLKLAGLSDFILVMPSDGGLWDGSAYLPLIDHGDYEKWITEDVVNAVIENIAGASNKSRLYITGLSMGGYGALRLGAKYPARFSAISAHSSVTSLDDLQQFIINPISDYQCEFEHEANLGYWLALNQQCIPPLRLDCGTEDSLYSSNVKLCQMLEKLSIDFKFESLPGAHEWPYWHEHVRKTLLFFDAHEKQLMSIA